MLKIASKDRFVSTPSNRAVLMMRRITAAALGAFALMSIPAMAEPPATGAIPALAGNGLGWISAGGFLDPPSGHGPIKQHSAYPFHGNLDGPGQ
jgi:hypothetical protein